MKRFIRILISFAMVIPFGIDAAPLTISETHVDVTCYGGNNGSIDITPIGGIFPYTYFWTGGIILEDRTSLTAGNYFVTVTDNIGDTATRSITITEPSAMSINSTGTLPSCFSGNNGTITITSVTGSTGPYTFVWSDGPTIQNRTGLSAGNYTVTATSNVGCTVASTISMGQPTPVTVSLVAVGVSCNGGNNGGINTTRSGGTAPYMYTWSDGGFTQNRTGLATGNYILTVTDLKGCTATASAFVTQPALALTVIAIPSPLACIGGPSGSVISSVSGGTSPYTYWWGGAVTSQNRINIPAGNYCVTATDANGCTANGCAIVPPYTPLGATFTQVDIICVSDTTGSIDLTVTDGTTPYTYAWSNGLTTQDISNLAQGIYLVTVTDNISCTISKTISINQPSFPLTVNTTVADVSCYGMVDGSISLNVTNGMSPYSYDWGGGITSQTRTGLLPGNYPVTITDNSGCSISSTAYVAEPTQLVVIPNHADVACYGDSSGIINLTATGSFAPYSYDWNDGGDTQNRNNIPIGNYSVLLTDLHGCTASASATISQPLARLTVTVTKGDATCFGSNTGWININVTGGTFPYTFDWGIVNTQNRTSLTAGIYTVTVQDNAGCISILSATINQPSPIAISSTVTNVVCNGGSNGTITITLSGGALPYSFIWNDGIAITQNRSGMNAGNYSVTITDANTCTVGTSFTITEPPPILTSTTIINPLCFGLSTGSIDLTVSGGTGTYLYSWNNTAVTQDINSIPAGNYLVNITDANNCVTSTTATVTQPTQIILSTTQINISCSSLNSGSIDLTVNGGTSPFIYTWSNSMITEDISSLTAGNYSVTINDNNSCSAITSVNITPATALSINETHTNISCNGMNDGSITVNASGGTSPYTYDWNGLFIQNRTSLSPGVYLLTVTDNTTCSGSASITITEPSVLALSETHNSYACASNAGSIDLTVTGGTLPYNYIWAHGPITQDVNNLSSGNYSVVVSDANSCSASVSINIAALTPLTLSATKTDLVCNGTNSGAIDLTVNGGAFPYSYAWSNNAVSQNLSGLAAGNYTVVITDANNCTATNSTVLAQPNAIQVNNSVVSVKCYGDSSGIINLSINGGTSPYYFTWNNLSATEDIFSLRAGNYSVTVTDQNGCYVSSNNITVSQPARINVAATVTPVSCIGRSNGEINLLVSGGTTPYRFNWNNQFTSINISNLNVGNYIATVTDVNGCSASTTQNIGLVPEMAISSVTQNTACEEVTTGAIDLTMNGGTPPYIFNWSNGSHTEDVSQLASGNYIVSVTDSRDCSTQVNFNITSDYDLQAETTESSEINLGESIQLTVSTNVDHGNMYSWAPKDLSCPTCSTTLANPVISTHYTVDVIDTNGCKASDELTVIVNSVTDIFIPNAFTPNDDGNNDELELYGNKGSITFFNFSLFNRWGEKVLESNDPNFKWDGIYKGEKVPSGVYLYVMKAVFVSGYSRDDFKGSVTVLR